MLKIITKFLLLLVLGYALLFVSVFAAQMLAAALRDPDAALIDNTPLGKANRRTETAAIVESIRKIVTMERTPQYQRDAHSKPHGCVRATFEVFESQTTYNHGIFKTPGKYQAWIRFSNGSVPALVDTKNDARGMAIKVMNVPGEQLLPPLLAGKTQDFVMINSPAFFIRSTADYRELEKAVARGEPFSYFFGAHYLNPFEWRLRQLYLALGTRKTAPATPLSAQYYSMTPYNLGPNQIKYSAKACENYQAPGVDYSQPNFLREAMKKVLSKQDTCFQFMAQIRKPNERMPIEDPTVEWSEEKSPYVPIARVHIPKQGFDTAAQNDMCEAMSFNVWHAVKGFEPISYFNLLRREVYLHTAAYRQVRNGMQAIEPNSWCDSLEQYCPQAPVDNASVGSTNVDVILPVSNSEQ
ncbi:MAG: catalase family protein [Arenicella sp.]|nr:catalase family protein [Arenicella sp.]